MTAVSTVANSRMFILASLFMGRTPPDPASRPAGARAAAEPRARSAEPLRRAGGDAVDQSPFLGWGLFARIASRQRYRCAGARCGVVSATMLSRSESTPGSASMI